MTPGRKPSTTTSALAASLLKISCPSPDFMFSVIERLLRFVNVWIVRRTQSSSAGRPGSGVSIFKTSAPMSASSIPGNSAGGTRASSRILIPSSTPMRICSVQVACEPRGEGANVGDVLEVRELLGDSLGLVARQDERRARAELGAERVGVEGRVRMPARPARPGRERASVPHPHGDAAPRVPRELVRERRVYDHRDALHEIAHGVVPDLAVLERAKVHASLGE